MIYYETKDVTTVEMGIVFHGCNAQGAFGSGVAGAIRSKWPKAHKEYVQHISNYKVMRTEALGSINPVGIAWNLLVINAITQQFYGHDGKVYADAKAIGTCLDKTHGYLERSGWRNVKLYMPMVGCGLGGLDWEADVKPVVQKVTTDFERLGIDIVVCTL